MNFSKSKALLFDLTIQYKALIVKQNSAFTEAILVMISFFSSDHIIGQTKETF